MQKSTSELAARSAAKFDLRTDANGRNEQEEGIYDGFIDVPGVFIEPPPLRAGLGQLAELLLERREAGLVVGHGVLGSRDWRGPRARPRAALMSLPSPVYPLRSLSLAKFEAREI